MWIIFIIVGIIIVYLIVNGNKLNSGTNTYSYQRDIQPNISNFKTSFPNFYEFIERDKPVSNAILHTENANKIEYKMPIMFYGNIVGYNHLGIEKSGNSYFMYTDSFSKRGFVIRGKRINISDDISYENYRNNLKQGFAYLMANENYLPLTMGQK